METQVCRGYMLQLWVWEPFRVYFYRSSRGCISCILQPSTDLDVLMCHSSVWEVFFPPRRLRKANKGNPPLNRWLFRKFRLGGICWLNLPQPGLQSSPGKLQLVGTCYWVWVGGSNKYVIVSRRVHHPQLTETTT